MSQRKRVSVNDERRMDIIFENASLRALVRELYAEDPGLQAWGGYPDVTAWLAPGLVTDESSLRKRSIA